MSQSRDEQPGPHAAPTPSAIATPTAVRRSLEGTLRPAGWAAAAYPAGG
jgi:hypothetical protein